MTEFKKGDRVVFVKDDGYYGVETPEGTLATYDAGYPTELAPWVRLDTGERVRAWRDCIAHAPETLAPLDPSKVAITLKGGDYIEAESDGTKIGGKVSHVTERGFVAIEHLGEFAIHHITPSPLPKGYRMFVLTAHTPAPEPEPEWKPGTFVSARINGRELPGERYQGFVTHHGTVMIANEDGSPESINLAHLRDVRPLVVIDPATVDVKSIGAVLRRTVRELFSWEEVARVVLAEVGIEVPR